MKNEKETTKMYIDIVGELRGLIKKENIKTGGKLPSERELASRLQVGRSTVREALRSLELLGLIETRRGEGTFLADFQKNRFVEVLADFIMQQPNSITEVLRTRRIHEKEAIRTICGDEALQALPVWESLLSKLHARQEVEREDIIREMIVATENRLSLKIWFLLKQYSDVTMGKITAKECDAVVELLHHVCTGKEPKALEAYEKWVCIVEGEREEPRNDS